MRKVTIIITALFLVSCNNATIDKKAFSVVKDTLQKNTALERVNRLFDNPYRNINNFNFQVGNQFIDSLHNVFSIANAIDTATINNICLVDNCESYQTFNNKKKKAIFYFFKGDGGEYGFSNDQYYLTNDSLAFVRNFSVDIKIWPTNTMQTVWLIQEVVYKIQAGKLTTNRKFVLTTNLSDFDFTLKTIKAKQIKLDFNETYNKHIEALKSLLALKNQKEPE